jgi:molybdopterin converting factor small subunit
MRQLREQYASQFAHNAIAIFHDILRRQTLAGMKNLKAAVNQTMASGEAAIKDGDEVAIFSAGDRWLTDMPLKDAPNDERYVRQPQVHSPSGRGARGESPSPTFMVSQ